MRYCKFSKDGAILENRKVQDMGDLAMILINCDFNDWLEGLGQPTCYKDIVTWETFGKFIQDIIF